MLAPTPYTWPPATPNSTLIPPEPELIPVDPFMGPDSWIVRSLRATRFIQVPGNLLRSQVTLLELGHLPKVLMMAASISRATALPWQ